jgi:DNA-binding SARP family transcriptional activator
MIRLRVLGTAGLLDNGGRELREVLVKPKSVALLVYLALAASRRFVRRDVLLALFWPESDTTHARNALRQTVHHLRHALGADVLVGRGMEELGVATVRLECDAVSFTEALAQGASAEALALYGGDLLPGFFIADCPDFERWLDEQRTALRERAREGAWDLAEAELAAGAPGPAAHWGRWAARLAPDDETTVRRLVDVLTRAGDRAGATRAYEDFSSRLQRDYGVAPAPETGAPLLTVPVPGPGAPRPPTPPTSPSRTGQPVVTRAWRWLAPAALIIVTLASLERLWRRHPLSASGVSEQSVAVLPFMVRGHDSLAYLRTGMVDLLSARLDAAARLRSVDPRAVLAVTQGMSATVWSDPARAARAAARLGADLYVVGDAVETAGRLQLDAVLIDRAGAATARATVEGETSHIFELADRLAAHLLAEHAGGSDTALTVLAGGTTRSLPAFKAYLAGEAAFDDGRYVQAVEAFRRAVAQDTGFALGYYRLAVAADWAGASQLSMGAARQAVERRERLSPLAQDLLGGFEAYAAYQGDAAEGAYLDIAGTHPDNLEAAYMLGEVRFHYNVPRGRLPGEARGSFERVLAIAPRDGPALIHLARVAALEGRLAELDSLVSRFLALYPDADRALEMRALRAFATGDRREQQRILSTMREQGDVALEVVSRGVGAFDQNLSGAGQLASLYLMPGRSAWLGPRGYELLSQLAVGRGRWTEARRHVAAFARLRPDWALASRASLALVPAAPVPAAELRAIQMAVTTWRPAPQADPPERLHLLPQLRAYLLTLLALRTGDSAVVRTALGQLDRMSAAPGDSGVARDLAHVVRAERALRSGHAPEALREIEGFRFAPETRTSRALTPIGAQARFLRGEILEALGHDEDALRWYASFPDPAAVDLAYLAPALLRQAEIAERLGRRADALAHYDRFLTVWQDCDPELNPMLDRAREAVVRLREGGAVSRR